MARRTGFIIWISTAMLALPVTSDAQDAGSQGNPTTAPRFDTEIVVTAERGDTPRREVPAATVVLEADAVPELPVVQLSEIGTFLPGFQLQQGQPYAVRPLISSRGFFGGGEAEYVLLLVDGVPTGDAESGLIDWFTVPMSSIR